MKTIPAVLLLACAGPAASWAAAVRGPQARSEAPVLPAALSAAPAAALTLPALSGLSADLGASSLSAPPMALGLTAPALQAVEAAPSPITEAAPEAAPPRTLSARAEAPAQDAPVAAILGREGTAAVQAVVENSRGAAPSSLAASSLYDGAGKPGSGDSAFAAADAVPSAHVLAWSPGLARLPESLPSPAALYFRALREASEAAGTAAGELRFAAASAATPIDDALWTFSFRFQAPKGAWQQVDVAFNRGLAASNEPYSQVRLYRGLPPPTLPLLPAQHFPSGDLLSAADALAAAQRELPRFGSRVSFSFEPSDDGLVYRIYSETGARAAVDARTGGVRVWPAPEPERGRAGRALDAVGLGWLLP
ncbi:MAG TPA: hypothetical protein VNI01_11180 [Elusimicrobiota bacterium]|nr:hypothetical protein [Elusimicrobiota bacterium]